MPDHDNITLGAMAASRCGSSCWHVTSTCNCIRSDSSEDPHSRSSPSRGVVSQVCNSVISGCPGIDTIALGSPSSFAVIESSWTCTCLKAKRFAHLFSQLVNRSPSMRSGTDMEDDHHDVVSSISDEGHSVLQHLKSEQAAHQCPQCQDHTLLENLYVSQQMMTGTPAASAIMATAAEPVRDTTVPFEFTADAPRNTCDIEVSR